METITCPASADSDVQYIIGIIRDKERIHLHNCLYCSQAERLLRELLPLLDILKECDYDSYREECRHLAVGMFSFLKSYLYTTTQRYDPNTYANCGDLGLSDLEEDLLGADSLFQGLFLLELSELEKSVLRVHQRTLTGLIVNVKACRKEVLRLKRKMRIGYYFDGPGKALLFMLAFFLVIFFIKRYG